MNALRNLQSPPAPFRRSSGIMPALLSPPGVGKARPGLGRQGLDEPPRAGWGEAGSAPIWREAVARKPGVEGTFWCHVLQAPFPPSQPHPAGRVACRGDGTSAPGGQKEKGGKKIKGKNSAQECLVRRPTPQSSRAGDRAARPWPLIWGYTPSPASPDRDRPRGPLN